MQLTRHDDDEFAIRAVDAPGAQCRGVQIAGQWWLAPFALIRSGPVELSSPFARLSELNPDVVKQFLTRFPVDVVLLSTGDRTIFPSAEVRAAFLSRGIGLEIMDFRSAAYTYNVLMQEHRAVALWSLA